MGTAIRIEPQAGGEQQHVGVGAEHRASRPGTGYFAADSLVETFHALGLGEVILDGAIGRVVGDAGKGVEIAGQPAIVLGNQAFEKRTGLIGRNTDQVGPGFFRARAARHNRALPLRIWNMPP